MNIVGVLGTIHDEQMRKESGYTLERLKEIILSFKPDIICGEIRPIDWNKYIEQEVYNDYLGPNEYRKLIIPLCDEHDIHFIPIDWFTDHLVHLKYSDGMSKEEIEEAEKYFNTIFEQYMKVGMSSELPFNSSEFNDFIKAKQEYQENLNAEVHGEYWLKRNEMMLSQIKKVMMDYEEKRILCTVGCEHVYKFLEELKKSECKLEFPLK
jgi:hypothetical protein